VSLTGQQIRLAWLTWSSGRERSEGVDVGELPWGTVTFLFTDVEGSTRRWEDHPEAMKLALARHDEILREAIRSHDGAVVKMTGDGVHAAFATAHDAVAAAVGAQRALAGEDFGETGELLVRMGIHTGPHQHDGGPHELAPTHPHWELKSEPDCTRARSRCAATT
jgi:class 3 adenylate cyclase